MSTTTTTTMSETQHTLGHIPAFISVDSQKIEIPRGDIKAPISFYAPPADGATPFNYVEDPPEGMPKNNFIYENKEIDIHDIRGRESQFNLNDHAFAVVGGIESQEKDFADDEHIKQVYYPEVEKTILDNVPGANRVFFFDHTIRRSAPGAPRAPVIRAHIDQTAKSAKQRVEFHLPDEAKELLQGRYRIINVWRPLNGPVVSSPLAFANSKTVPDSAVVPVEHRYPTRTGETAGIEYTQGQEWHYWSGMTNDERIFLQCYDSEGTNARVPHTAFVHPETKAHFPGRDSIEVRALVFG